MRIFSKNKRELSIAKEQKQLTADPIVQGRKLTENIWNNGYKEIGLMMLED